MADTLAEKQNPTISDLPGEGKRLSVLGVPLHFGQSMAGVDLGPGAMRVAGLTV